MTSPNVNAGTVLAPDPLPEPTVSREYVKHQSSRPRSNDGVLDIGAFEMEDGQPADLVLTTNSLPAGTVGTSYHSIFTATGGVPPYSWSQAGGTLPPGLSIGATAGDIAGTPTTAGMWNFSVQVSDSQTAADTASRAFTVTIAAAPPPSPVTITTTSLPNAPEQELQPDAHRHRRHDALRVEPGGGQRAAWPQPRGIDRRDQRQGHDARDVCVHGARDGQPVARGDGDEGVVDYGNEINNLVGATGATRSRATRISMP
jgi:Putative Ig domain